MLRPLTRLFDLSAHIPTNFRNPQRWLGGSVTSGEVLEVGFPGLFLLLGVTRGVTSKLLPAPKIPALPPPHCQKMLSTLAGLATATVTGT